MSAKEKDRFLDEPEFELHPDYPLPDVDDPVMRPFWEGARQGKLLLQRDRRDGSVHWPPKPPYWKGGVLEWFEASGRGRIYSYVVAHEPFLPAFRHLLPLVLVLVELEEGPRLVGYMVGVKPEDVSFGMPVEVVFRRLTDRVVLPVWRPARGGSS
ncbi:MAG: hypothetical protein KatS3mg076_2554 [Candidatus Binatia bacterium]|nr:MAG: hypothetical protein KatS3mg076_2554 [Candidatus Binatia bacterium]